MNQGSGVENAPCVTTGAAAGSRPRRAAGFAPKHRLWPFGARAIGTRALWCAALLLVLCAPAVAIETLSVSFGMKTAAGGRALQSTYDAAPAEGRLLAELPPYTNPTLPIGEQLFLVLMLDTASGDVSQFALNVREPTGARRPLSREDPLVLTGGETMPMVELWMRGNAASGDYSVTVSVAQVRGTKGLTSRFGDFSSEERTIPMPGTCPHEPGGPVVSEEKVEMIAKLNERLCQLAFDNDFYGIKKKLKGFGERYIGEPITILEAYPYIRCNGSSTVDLDLFRLIAQYPSRDLFMSNLIFHLADEAPCGPTFLRKHVTCGKDIGYGCVNIFEHIDHKRRKHSQSPDWVERYNHFESYLNDKVYQLGGPVRDARFCREILYEAERCPSGW